MKFQIIKDMDKKKIIKIVAIFLIVILVVLGICLYFFNEQIRKWTDLNILRKEIKVDKVKTIYLDTGKNNQVFGYGKYIGVLNDKNLKVYNGSGENIVNLSVDINTAISASNDKYLILAEKNGQNICAIFDKEYGWNQKTEGEIQQIYVSKNGYVAVVTTDTTYKAIITLYDNTGKQLFRSFLSSTRVADVSISNDENYLAYAEIDATGTLVKSTVTVISVKNAQNKSEDAVAYKYESNNSQIAVNIQYQEKQKLICMYNDSIKRMMQNNEEILLSINDKSTFASIDLNNHIAYITEDGTGLLNSNSVLNIINVQNNQKSTYTFDEIAKDMYTYNNIIGVNVGTDIYFINANGMLKKKYTSNQEITNFTIINEMALLLYKDRIEIINL